MGNFQDKVSFIWDLADLLRGSYKRNEYQKVILPFTVFKRFDSVLEYPKPAVLESYNNFKDSIDKLDYILQDVAVDKDQCSINIQSGNDRTKIVIWNFINELWITRT